MTENAEGAIVTYCMIAEGSIVCNKPQPARQGRGTPPS